MLGVGGLSLSFGGGGEGGRGGRGGGHLSSRMLLVDRPFLPRFLQGVRVTPRFQRQQQQLKQQVIVRFLTCRL